MILLFRFLNRERTCIRFLLRLEKDYEHLLVDSLDFWLFSCSELANGEQIVGEVVRLLSEWKGPDLILVSCEVGLGPLAMSTRSP